MTTAEGQVNTDILDWPGTARRLRRSALGLAAVVVTVFVVVSLSRGEATLGLLGELVGLALLVAFLIEVVVVGRAALRAMLTAGERGERLAGQDVGLLPPQLLRRARGQEGCGPAGCAPPATGEDRPGRDAGTQGPG